MKNNGQNKQKKIYQYVSHNILLPRFLAIWGLIASVLMSIGFIRFFSLSIWYVLLWGIPAFFVVANRFGRYLVMLFYPKFSIKRHAEFIKKFFANEAQPSVDVFVPVAGEDPSLIEKTMQGVAALDYNNYQSYLLDDGQNHPELKVFCKKYGFKYLARENKGEFRKAGNLQYGYDNSSGKYVVVFDADFVPDPSFLQHTIPYLEHDKKIGILQTPQYFDGSADLHRRCPIEFGGGNVVEDFYRFDMPSRARLGAGMCVGTSAVYRKEAIVKAGGPPKVTGTEDVRQGFKVNGVGYRVEYLPLVLSQGISPDTTEGYFAQHKRWCTGSIEALFGKYFWGSKLSIIGKLVFFNNLSFYVSGGLSVILVFHVFALLFFHYEELTWVNAVWFIPQLLLSFVFPFFYRIVRPRYGMYLAAITQMFTYAYTIPGIILRNIFKVEFVWEAANKKDAKVKPDFLGLVKMSILLYSLYILTFVALAFISPNDLLIINKTGLLVFWFAYSATIWGMYVINLSREVLGKLLEGNRRSIISSSLTYRYAITVPGALIIVLVITTMAGSIGLVQSNYRLVPRQKESDFLALQTEIREGFFGPDDDDSSSFAGTVAGESTIDEEVLKFVKESERKAKSAYVYKVKRGDSLSKLAKQSMQEYLDDTGIKLSLGQRLYVSYHILKEYGFKQLYVGQKAKISTDILIKYTTQAVKISNSQKNYLDNYATKIGYT